MCLGPCEALLVDTKLLSSVSFPHVMKEYSYFLFFPPTIKTVRKTTLGSLVLQKQESSRIWPEGPRMAGIMLSRCGFQIHKVAGGVGTSLAPAGLQDTWRACVGSSLCPWAVEQQGRAESSWSWKRNKRLPQSRPCHARTGAVSEDVLADPPVPGSGGGLRFPGR